VSGLQWTVAAYTIVLAALLMFSGAVADRIGRRTIFQVGLSLFTLGSWLCSLAPSLGWLIAFRILQGVGGSMLNPAALGIITNTFTGRAERARAIGVWDGVFGLSMALGTGPGRRAGRNGRLARDLLGQHPGGPGRHLADRAVRAGLQGAHGPAAPTRSASSSSS
jgi:MFS family permease